MQRNSICYCFIKSKKQIDIFEHNSANVQRKPFVALFYWSQPCLVLSANNFTMMPEYQQLLLFHNTNNRHICTCIRFNKCVRDSCPLVVWVTWAPFCLVAVTVISPSNGFWKWLGKICRSEERLQIGWLC